MASARPKKTAPQPKTAEPKTAQKPAGHEIRATSVASGFAALTHEIQAYGGRSLDHGGEALEALLSAHSLSEAAEIQYKYYMDACERHLEHLRNIQIAAIDLGLKAFDPAALPENKAA